MKINDSEKVNWDDRFMKLSQYIAGWSKDKSTGVGAIICDNDNRIVSIGYNGFPTGSNDEDLSRHERPKKYLFTEHAERNAVYNAARIGVKTKGCKMYLMWFPCADCARSIIQSGIKKLICFPPDLKQKKWGEHFEASKEMLEECGVEIIYLNESNYK